MISKALRPCFIVRAKMHPRKDKWIAISEILFYNEGAVILK